MNEAPGDGARSAHEGQWLHDIARELFPLHRSLTGDGVRQTLSILKRYLPGLTFHEIPSGTKVLDWTIPDEWRIDAAYIETPDGRLIADIRENNVHVMSYSTPVDVAVGLDELNEHLHSDEEIPHAIPYVTSYYNRDWGFCITQTERDGLAEGTYRAVIEGALTPGSMTYADLVIPGECSEEILISTYICHPSLANNELSGPMVSLGLATWLAREPRRYTYRFVFVPETIGAITYIATHLEHLRSKVVGAINLTCIGDDGDYSYLASRSGNTALDRIASRVISTREPRKIYSYLDRGSDERQYGMPGVDLPVISLMRTKYGVYPEYHTHLDDLTVVTPSGLQGGLDLVRECIVELENSDFYQATVTGEPQLGKRGLYHSVHARTVSETILLRTHILAYSDGQHSLQDIAEMTGAPLAEVQVLATELEDHALLVRTPLTSR